MPVAPFDNEKMFEAVMRSLEMLKNLQGHDGWKLYQAMLDGQKDELTSKIETAMTGEQAIRVAGAMAMHRIASQWLPMQIKALEEQRQDIINKQNNLSRR